MKIQSSPLRGIFFSFAIRAKARFRLQDLHEDFGVIAGRQAMVITLGLAQETRRFFVFLCKDIGVRCVHCFSFQEMLGIIAQVTGVTSDWVIGPTPHFQLSPARTERLPICNGLHASPSPNSGCSLRRKRKSAPLWVCVGPVHGLSKVTAHLIMVS